MRGGMEAIYDETASGDDIASGDDVGPGDDIAPKIGFMAFPPSSPPADRCSPPPTAPIKARNSIQWCLNKISTANDNRRIGPDRIVLRAKIDKNRNRF